MHISSGAPDAPLHHEPWNKGKLVGPKPPLTLQQVWEIRIRLQILNQTRDLALFNLAIDGKLRSCDLVRLRVADITHGGRVLPRAAVLQRKTRLPVRFELTDHIRDAVQAWIDQRSLAAGDYLFPSRVRTAQPISTRQYARIVDSWVSLIGLDHHEYGTHTLRRTKATLIYRQTKNLRAVQILLGHTKLESTTRYLGIEVDDALEIAEHTDV